MLRDRKTREDNPQAQAVVATIDDVVSPCSQEREQREGEGNAAASIKPPLGDVFSRSSHHDMSTSSMTSSVISKIDTTDVEAMMDGGLDRFYEKLQVHHGKRYSYECTFKSLAFRANLKVRDPETMLTWVKRPFSRCMGKSMSEKKTVLYPMMGKVPSGSLTLLLGGPHSGKTTLLKILCGSIPSADDTGSFVKMNGVDVRKVAKTTRCIGMVPQRDEHHATLTVQETLEFARKCHMGIQNDELSSLRTEFIMKLLGISHCRDTIVGSAAAGLRGVSGGERKRVTIGECLVGEQGFVCMDEMNTGLDSSATLDVVKAMRSWSDSLGGTCVISMLQPQSDVMEVFDSIMLLNDGRLVYNGPINKVAMHFAEIGLVAPEHVELADWLLKDICAHDDPDMLYEHYEKSFCSNKLHSLGPAFNAITEEDSDDENGIGNTVSSVDLHNIHLEQIDISNKHPFALTFVQDLKCQFSRAWKLNVRNRVLNFSMFFEALLISLLLGFGFWDTQDPQQVMSLLFALASLLIRQAWQVIPIVVGDRCIFYKQRALNMHRTSTFVIAQAVSQLPINTLVILLLTTPLFFMADLAGGEFARYLATGVMLLLLQQALRAWMTFFAASSPNANVAQAISAVFVVLALIFSGFIMLEGLIPSWAIWLYWISPISWGMRSLAQIEFLSPFWDTPRGGDYQYNGIQSLEVYQFSTDSHYIVYGAFVLIAYYFIFAFGFTFLAYHYIRPAQNYVFRLVGKSARDEYVEVDILIEEKRNTCQHLNQIGALSEVGNDQDKDKKIVIVEPAVVSNNFTPASIYVRDLRYQVSIPGGETIELLQGITAHFQAGSLTCLMGSSGAGKTTLMDVIAGRKTGGKITGDILVNGGVVDQTTFARMMGYCEQFDTQSPNMTVWESMLFSAKLRRDLKQQREESNEDWCWKQICLLEMEDLVDKRIGEAPTGLSIEQRKRLSIGQELAANPSIIFADEPTSGLSSDAALLVVKTLKKVADSGRTVLATIHQPSTEIFCAFENLLLLKRGGQIVFFGPLGPGAQNLLDYFENIPGSPKCELQENPASYMLRAIGAGVNCNQQLPDYASVYETTENYRETLRKVENVVNNPQVGIHKMDKYATSYFTQLKECYVRTQRVYFRSPEYTVIRLALSLIIGVFLGGMYYQFGYETTDQARSQVAIIYLSMDMIGIISMVLVTPLAFRERAAFYRETSSSYYANTAHAWAMILVEIPYICLSVAFYVLPSYWMVGLDPNFSSFISFYLIWVGFIFITTFLAISFSFLLPTAAVSQVFIGILTGVFNIFSGFLLTFKAIPAPLLLFYYVNTDTYVLNSLIVSISRPDYPVFDPVLNTTTTLTDFIVDAYSFNPDRVHIDMIVMVGWICFFISAAILGSKYVTYIKR